MSIIEQYLALKKQASGALVLMRIGEFYETYFDDAKCVAQALDITLTKRGRDNIPMCGFPWLSIENYIEKLVNEGGYSIAICEPIEIKEKSGLIKRDIVKIISRGTIFSEKLKKDNRYILAIARENDLYGLAFADITTGDFFCKTSIDPIADSNLYSPCEVVLQEGVKLEINHSNYYYCQQLEGPLHDLYKNQQLLQHLPPALKLAAGLMIAYLNKAQQGLVDLLRVPRILENQYFMQIDKRVQDSLEIFSSRGLSSVIDYTITAAGARLLKKYLAAPLLDPKSIDKRLDLVEFFTKNDKLTKSLREMLRSTADLERIINRLALNKVNPTELITLSTSLKWCLEISRLIYNAKELHRFYHLMPDNGKLIELIDSYISDTNHHHINLAASARLQKTLGLKEEARVRLIELEQEYRAVTGLPKLKINCNNMIGYFIEVPSEEVLSGKFTFKQGLSNVNRYVTLELKELELSIVNVDKISKEIASEVISYVVGKLVEERENIYLSAEGLAELDLYSSLAVLARKHCYTRPILKDSEGKEFKVLKGRHPTLERTMEFVANDIDLQDKIMLLTGPNMAGKSTYLRQNALIAILAQMGCFVPAEYAEIGVVDKIFSRVGAGDDIAAGQSTFMVEMQEVAFILAHATCFSLIIMDEVGRGTGDQEGYAIAEAILRYIFDHNKARTIFATHHLKLAQIPYVECHTVQSEGIADDIIITHKIIPGVSTRSYGINVARKAGLPLAVISEAEKILASLEP